MLLRFHRAPKSKKRDAGVTALTIVQVVTTFIAIPLIATHVADRWLLDACRLLSAIICATAFTKKWRIQVALLVILLAAVAGPPALLQLTTGLTINRALVHETISCASFGFTLVVTALVARHTFGSGQVTGHKILGAVLIYLNVAVMFSIAYDMLDTFSAGAVQLANGGSVLNGRGARIAELSYFSLTTITTTGYGDLVPVHPLARSLANLESVFGALFPATFVARLVALHLAHSESTGDAINRSDRN